MCRYCDVIKICTNSGAVQTMSSFSQDVTSKPAQHWRVIIRWFEAQIAARNLTVGDKLPTELQICEQFSTNRHTVRRALAYLQARGLVESTQGRGSFVRRPTLIYQIGRRTRFSAVLEQQAANPQTKTLVFETRVAEPHVANALGIKAGAPTIYLERLGLANEQPISVACHWFSLERFPFSTFEVFYQRSKSITQTLIDCGVPDYTRSKTTISARLPTAREAELLHVPRHIPLLMTQAWNVDGLSRPLEYGEARMASDRVEISIDTEVKPSLD
jgi:GntR family transcriptional regulator, phosphonate transport system regulatory protein